MKKLLFLSFLLLSLVQIRAYDKINFHVLDVKSGISDNYILDILHDDYGFMWFATRNGLSRYDGYRFKRYTITQLGSYDNNVEWVKQDASKTIWVKTPVNYCCYNREKDELENTIEQRLEQLGIRGTPKQLFIDEDRNLWCTTDNTLYYYQFSTEKLSALPFSGEIVDFTCRQAYAYLLLPGGNVSRVDWVSQSVERIAEVDSYSGFSSHIYIDMDLKLWLYATHGHGIRCYSTKEKRWVTFPGKQALENDRCNITTVIDDGKENIWIGTDNNGILVSQMTRGSYTQICKEPGKMFSLPNNHVTCIFKDDKNVMWIGTGKQGVAYARLGGVIMENNRCPEQEDVSCLLEEEDGTLWLGFDGEGIARCDRNATHYTYYRSQEGTIPSNLIVCSYRDSKGRIWWGSFGGGAFYYENGRFATPAYLRQADDVDIPHYVRRIAEDADGNLWFATYTQGLYRMDANGGLTAYTIDNSVLLTNYIADLSCTDGRMLYIATSSGVYSMDTSTLQMTRLERKSSEELLIQGNFANCIYKDSRGLLWIGGREGIHVYDLQTDSVTCIATDEGLSDPYIRAMVEDQSKNMWVTTDHGVTHIGVIRNARTGATDFRCTPYFEQDGIADLTLNNFSIYCNRQNEVLVGGSGGYIKIHPDVAATEQKGHRVVFTGFYVGSERIDAGKPLPDGRVLLPRNIQLFDEITVHYSDNNFSIEVSAMEYGLLHKLQYRYRLDGNDPWIKLEGNRIYFNKLAPGTYHLEVQVMDRPDGEDNPVASLILHVRPPWWLSMPAYILYTLLILSAVVFGIVRMKRKHRRLLRLQKREMEVAHRQEIDEAKFRFFTNISHDLRTPLSLIITPLEKLLESDRAAGMKDDLKLMHRNALVLLDVVNQLLELRKIDNGKVAINQSHGNLSEFVREVCSSFESHGERQDIRLDLRLESADVETDFDRNKMQRVLMNLLSNAFKYNVEQGSVTVTVRQTTPRTVCIEVADTGIGIRDENKKKIFDRFFQEDHLSTTYVGSGIGLHIVKEYVALHDGEIEVRDNQPQGTVFCITLPIRNAQDVPVLSVPTAPQEEIPEGKKDVKETALLVVEDNDDFRRFLTDNLKEHYRVFEAANGQQALEVLEANEIGLVISDVRMPVMDGLELCNKIKGDILYSHIPVILLTARTTDEHVLEGLREGADDYITKPFNLSILLLRIGKMLEWTANNHRKFTSKMDVSPAEITVSTLDGQLIEKAIRIVEEHMDNSEFSVEELSALIGMSRGHLYKKMISITGKSPIEFIRVLRIKRGRQLIEQEYESISQIAYKIGLSPKLFSKYFKEEYGVLPSEYGKKR